MKNINILMLVLAFAISSVLTAQMAITPDGSDADASAMMDVKSTEKGMLVPRMSAAERDLIVTPASGLLVFVTDDNNFYYFDGTAWKQFSGGTDGDWITNGNNIFSGPSGNVGVGYPNPGQKLEVNGNVKGTNYYGNGNTLSFGSNSNMQPSLTITYIIALTGTYPSQTKGVDPYIGEISMFAGNFAPLGWALCDGQILQISSYNALFSLLGTTYGGDGETTFGLPDLRGRAAMHWGNAPGLSNRQLGQNVGVEKVGQ